MTNVQVQCCHCKGEGSVEHYKVVNSEWASWAMPVDPFHMVPCPTCNGFGVVIATELKAVTSWEQIRRPEQC